MALVRQTAGSITHVILRPKGQVPAESFHLDGLIKIQAEPPDRYCDSILISVVPIPHKILPFVCQTRG